MKLCKFFLIVLKSFSVSVKNTFCQTNDDVSRLNFKKYWNRHDYFLRPDVADSSVSDIFTS